MKIILRRAEFWLAFGLAAVLNFSIRGAEAQSVVDWSQFLARHDLVWDGPATNWESGAFIGNGLLGAMIYSTAADGSLQWEVGRSDVTEKGDRMAIGRFVLKVGSLGSRMRLDLWNAEVRGELGSGTEFASTMKWRSFTHAEKLLNVIELNGTGTYQSPEIEFEHSEANPARLEYQHQPIPDSDKNPEAVFGKTGEVNWCQQDFNAGGGYVVAWTTKVLS